MDEKAYMSIVNTARNHIEQRQIDDTYDYKIKRSKFNKIFLIFGIISVVIFIAGIYLYKFAFANSEMISNANMLQIVGIMMSAGGIVLPFFIFSFIPRKNNVDYDIELYNEIKEDIIYYISSLCNTSVENISYDINNFITRNKRQLGVETKTIYSKFTNPATGRINTRQENISIESFWLDKRKVDFIYDKCCEKYHKKSTSMVKENLSIQKSQLQNENLSLKNETLKIKINLTKPWTCQFCGNMNRGSDMECLKCGGIRSSQ